MKNKTKTKQSTPKTIPPLSAEAVFNMNQRTNADGSSYMFL